MRACVFQNNVNVLTVSMKAHLFRIISSFGFSCSDLFLKCVSIFHILNPECVCVCVGE